MEHPDFSSYGSNRMGSPSFIERLRSGKTRLDNASPAARTSVFLADVRTSVRPTLRSLSSEVCARITRGLLDTVPGRTQKYSRIRSITAPRS